MAGLGLGSIFWGKKIDRTPNPRKVLGMLELGIGISSFIVLLIFSRLQIIYRFIFHHLNAGAGITAIIIFLVAFALMFFPTFLMGGTFPVISKVYIKRNEDIGKGIGLLYAVNTLGGIIGAALAGFVFIRQLGMNITQLLAMAINITIGLLITILLSAGHDRQPAIAHYKTKDAADEKHILSLILWIAGITGFTGMACEILWIRALSSFLANSTYTFTIVLIVFLAGITVGSFIFTKFLERTRFLLQIFASIQTLLGAYVIVTAVFMNKLPGLLFSIGGLLEIPVLRIMLPVFFLASAIMLIPTILMGISFPLIYKIYSKGIDKLGHDVSMVYFFNTAGSIAGPLIAGFVLIPIVGVVRGVITVSSLNIMVGLTLTGLKPFKQYKNRFNLITIGLTVIAVGAIVLGLKNTWLLPPSISRTATRSDRIIYYRETREGTVVASEDRYTGIRACYINNSAVIGTTYDALKVVKLLGHLPFLANPEAKQALVIGFGVGVTTASLAKHPVNEIDCVEICPGVKDAARFFGAYNNHIFNNPKVDFIRGDGRNYLLLTNKKYDIISCDPTHPTLGSGNLYTQEYFQLCKAHLNKNGVVCQYLPFHKLSPDEFKSAIRTFFSVFPHTTIWLAHSHGIMMGSWNKLQIDFEYLKKYLEALNDDILYDPYLFAVSLVLDENEVQQLARNTVINNDDRPCLEYFMPGSLKKENWEVNVETILKSRSEINRSIDNIEDPDKLARYLEGQKHFIAGLVFWNRNDRQKAIDEYRAGLTINPENNEIKLFLENESGELR